MARKTGAVAMDNKREMTERLASKMIASYGVEVVALAFMVTPATVRSWAAGRTAAMNSQRDRMSKALFNPQNMKELLFDAAQDYTSNAAFYQNRKPDMAFRNTSLAAQALAARAAL